MPRHCSMRWRNVDNELLRRVSDLTSIEEAMHDARRLHASSGAIPGVHLLLHQTPWSTASRNRYAAIFSGLGSCGAPHGRDVGAERMHRACARASTFHTAPAFTGSITRFGV